MFNRNISLRVITLLVTVLCCLDVGPANAFQFAKPASIDCVGVRKRHVVYDSNKSMLLKKWSIGSLEHVRTRRSPFFFPPLKMGRAAAVRANTKAKTDARKAKVNALYGKKIIVAVKAGGSPNPEANMLLKETIARAKANNVPVDNINRAIKKASEANTADFSESLYEAYGHGGASFVITVLTDNPNRANMEIRSAVNKNHGKMAEQGSVLFLYDRKGKLEVDKILDEEQLMNAAIDAGVDDFEIADGEEEASCVVFVDPKDATAMSDAIQTLDGANSKFSLAYVSKAPVEVTDDEFEKNMKIYDALMELDDVDQVEHNMSN